MSERGVDVDYSTLYRWVQRYACLRNGSAGTGLPVAVLAR